MCEPDGQETRGFNFRYLRLWPLLDCGSIFSLQIGLKIESKVVGGDVPLKINIHGVSSLFAKFIGQRDLKGLVNIPLNNPNLADGLLNFVESEKCFVITNSHSDGLIVWVNYLRQSKRPRNRVCLWRLCHILRNKLKLKVWRFFDWLD